MTDHDVRRKPDDEAERQPQSSVRVGCRQPNGLRIRLTIKEPDDPFKQPRLSAAVRLNGPSSSVAAGVGDPTGAGDAFGVTDVDAEFWRAWLARNEGRNPLLDGGTIFLLDDEERPEENPT